jgi:hypothetical protein
VETVAATEVVATVVVVTAEAVMTAEVETVVATEVVATVGVVTAEAVMTAEVETVVATEVVATVGVVTAEVVTTVAVERPTAGQNRVMMTISAVVAAIVGFAAKVRLGISVTCRPQTLSKRRSVTIEVSSWQAIPTSVLKSTISMPSRRRKMMTVKVPFPALGRWSN